MEPLIIEVAGLPGPQGSKKAVGTRTGKRGQRVPILIESSKKVKPWREQVVAAAVLAARAHPGWEGPITADDGGRCNIVFRFARPKTHYGTGRNAAILKEGAPAHPMSKTVHGDSDKLLRATFDALETAQIVVGDEMIVAGRYRKRWCLPGETPGATIQALPDDGVDDTIVTSPPLGEVLDGFRAEVTSGAGIRLVCVACRAYLPGASGWQVQLAYLADAALDHLRAVHARPGAA